MGSNDEWLKGEKLWTYKYFSPELMKGQNYNRTADFWAVGVTLLELSGIQKAPYAGENKEVVLEKMRKEKVFRLK